MQEQSQLLTRQAVERRCVISRATLYRWVAEGLFPAPIQIGPRAVRWLAADVDEWLASRPRASRRAGA